MGACLSALTEIDREGVRVRVEVRVEVESGQTPYITSVDLVLIHIFISLVFVTHSHQAFHNIC